MGEEEFNEIRRSIDAGRENRDNRNDDYNPQIRASPLKLKRIRVRSKDNESADR